MFVCRAAYLHFRWQIQYQLSLTHIVSLTLSKPICQTLKSYGANAVSSGISNHRTPLFYACSCVCLSRLPWQTNSTFIISFFPRFLILYFGFPYIHKSFQTPRCICRTGGWKHHCFYPRHRFNILDIHPFSSFPIYDYLLNL